MSSIDERVGIKTDEDQRLAKLLQTLAVIATVVSTSDKLPNAFNGLSPLQDNLGVAGNLIYFSFVTLTTVGYGDLVPLHPIARALANVEAIIGQLYPATLLARLVTLEIENRRKS